jgi:hypothetical protein
VSWAPAGCWSRRSSPCAFFRCFFRVAPLDRIISSFQGMAGTTAPPFFSRRGRAFTSGRALRTSFSFPSFIFIFRFFIFSSCFISASSAGVQPSAPPPGQPTAYPLLPCVALRWCCVALRCTSYRTASV